MTLQHSDVGSLPLAPARRAAICAALLQAQGSDPTLQLLAQHHGAVIVDDLCRLAAFVHEQGISDAALACAAAEGNPAISSVARIVYSARLQFRAAGFAATMPAAHSQLRRITRSSLQSALETLCDAAVSTARVPRRLLDNLRIPAERPSMCGAVARMLAAAYLGATEHVVQALCDAPYSIESGNLRAALASRREPKPRDAVAAAVGALRGVEAKEAAVAAVSALDAAQQHREFKDFSLAATLRSLEKAVTQWAQRDGGDYSDADFSDLLRAATSADRVWSAGPSAPEPAVQVATLLDGRASLRVINDLRLLPYGCTDASADAADIRFEDAPGALIEWDAFAAALDVAAGPQSQLAAGGSFAVHIAAPLARAAVAYLLETARAADRRVWPQPETPAALTAPPMTFSASRLNAFVKCPRRWFYEYLCEALEDPASLHAAYGRVVHDALEALHREIRVPGRYAAPVILERLLRELDVAFGRSRVDFDSQLEYEVSRHRARRMAEQYVRWLTQEAARAPLEIVDVEVQQRRRFGEHEFVGYIDRIDRPLGGGPVTIFDYKTGRIDTNAREYLDKVRRGDEAQLALYYAMRRASGDEIARIALVSIRDPRDDVWILALDIVDDNGKAIVEREPVDGVLRASCSRADLDASLAALIERCDFLTKQGMDHFPAGDDPPCNYCAYAQACRERPLDGERIFAR